MIGINGTGKTSVLKLILGLISPSYNYLNQIEFDFVEVSFGKTIDNPTQLVRASRQDEKTVKIQLVTKASNDSVEGILKRSKWAYQELSAPEEISERIKSYKADFESQEIYKQLRKVTTPLFLGL